MLNILDFLFPRRRNHVDSACPPPSFLCSLMASTNTNAAAVLQMLEDEREDNHRRFLFRGFDDDWDDDERSIDGHDFRDLYMPAPAAAALEEQVLMNQPCLAAAAPDASPPRKKSRRNYERKPHIASHWWVNHLTPEIREQYLADPHGRMSLKFRRLFRVPFVLFLDLVAISKERWWRNWTPTKVDAAGLLISNLELKLLGALFVLGSGCTQFIVSTQTNMSKEVHRVFFLAWVSKMSSIQTEFIYMPSDEVTFQKVVGEYTSRGLPGCVGSVDVVHIAWDRCPTQYMNMFKGKEGFPSIAYEIICTSRKFVQSVSCGHPGARNDKHIVRTDESVMQLLEGNGWLHSKAWRAMGPNQQVKVFKGVYLICDGGYHRWPCLVSPVKHGIAGSPTMKWSAKLESVRKDIEGVFGILKVRFRFLKNFNNLHRQQSVDDCFVTCCMLHNMLLKSDGYLEETLTPFPGGVEERLARKFGNSWNGQDGFWNRQNDDTVDQQMEDENRRATPA